MTTQPLTTAQDLSASITATLRRGLEHAEAMAADIRDALGLPPAITVATEDLRNVLDYARHYDVDDDPAMVRVTTALTESGQA